jgi:flagellar biosynthetic protein FliR
VLNFSSAVAIIDLFENIDILLLIMVRCVGFFVLLPIFSGANVPAYTKIAFSLLTSYLVFSSGIVTEVTYDPSTLGYFYLLVIEFLTGFVLAFAVYIVFMAFYMAGQIIDYQIGFSMVSVLDPVTQIQVPITGNLLYMLILLTLVTTHGINHIIGAFLYSFEKIPPGGANMLANEGMLNMAVDIIVNFMVVGVKISMPILGTILVLDVGLGILVKAVPQMNVFVVGMPIKLLIGLAVFIIIVPIFSTIYENIFWESYRNLQNFTEVMPP